MDFQYSPPTLTLDTSHEVLITQVTDAGHFHCQQVSSFEPLKLLSNMLQLYCESMASQTDRITRVLRDQACLAKHSGTWYRAFVRELLGDGQVEVTFVDYGKSEVVQPMALRKMRAEFCELPIQAVLCGLSDVQPTGDFWTPQQSAQLEDIIRDKIFTAKFIRLNDSQEVCVVELWDSGININNLFAQKAGLVTSSATSVASSRKTISSHDQAVGVLRRPAFSGNINPIFENTQKLSGSKNLCSAQSGTSKNNHLSQNQNSATSIPANTSRSYKSPDVKIGQMLEMTVVYVNTPSDFWCQPNDRINDIDLMMDKLNIVYSQQVDVPAIQGLQVNSTCIAKYSVDNRWYRALVTKDDHTHAEVQFVDYGNFEYINVMELKAVKDEFFNLPILCSQCCLSRVSCSEPEWTDKAIAKFEEFTLEMVFKSNIKGIDKNGKLLVELVNISTSEDSVNQQMVQLGLAKQCELSSQNTIALSNAALSSSTMLAYKEFALSVGTKYEVVISWMDSPHRFWCQIISQQEDIESLGKAVQMYYSMASSAQPINKLLMAGSLVVSRFSGDGQWYRAIVIQPGIQKVKLQFVDYGNSSEEPLTNLREMEKKFLEQPVFAFECSLRNAQPCGSTWSSTVVNKIQSLLCDQTISINTHSKEHNSHIVDVCTGHGNLIDLLALAGEVQGTSPRLALDNQPKYMYPDALLFEPGSTVDVYISHIDSSTSFSCQLLQSTELLEHILDDLDAAYSTTEPNNSMVCSTNMACVAQFSEDGVWYRAEIIEITSSNIRVCFVDYGNSELTNVGCLRHITSDFAKTPRQAVHCCLNGIDVDSSELTTHLTNLTTDKPLNAKIISFDGSKFMLDLRDKASGLNINMQLCGPKPSHHCTVRTYPKRAIPVSITSAFVSAVSSVGELYFQPIAVEDQIQQLTDKLQLHGENFDSGQCKVNQVQKGMACCSKFSTDEAWYRAVVTDLKDNSITVNFVDFGNEETIPATPVCLHHVPDELITIPPFAFKCQIVEENLSSEQVHAMKELLMEQEVDFQIINQTEPYLAFVKNKSGNNLKDILFPTVEKPSMATVSQKTYAPDRLPKGHNDSAYISHVEQLSGDVFIQLCDYEDELYSLDKNLQVLLGGSGDTDLSTISHGIGAPCCAVFSEDNKWYRSVIVDDIGSHVRVRFVDYGNMDTVIKSSLRTVPTKLMTVPPLALRCRLDGIAEISSMDSDMIMELTQDKAITVYNKTTTEPYLICVILDDGTKLNDKLSANEGSAQNIKPNGQATTHLPTSFPSRLPPGQNVTGYISDIDEHGVLYIGQFAEDNTLDDVTEKLDLFTEQFASDTYNITDNDIKIGFCCCAISPADREWYRAIVIAILEEGNVKVRFVDYGDSSVISRTNLRSVPDELMHTSACCVKARLHTKDTLSESEIRLLKYHVTDLPINLEFVSVVEPLTVSFNLHTGTDVLTLFSAAKQQILPPFVIPAEKALAYVVNIDTSSILHIQLVRDKEGLDKVYRLIEKYTGKFENGHAFDDIASVTYCCAKFTQDQTWYRALVTDVVGDKVTVRFIDYGNSDTISQTALRGLPEDLASLPPLCITAYLDGHEQLSPVDIADLNNSLEDNLVYVSFKSVSEPYRVCIETKQGSNILAPLLIKSSVTTIASTFPSKAVPQFPEPNIPSHIAQAYIINIDSTGLLHLHLANSDERLHEITELIEHHSTEFERDCTVLENPTIGATCIARFSDDMAWYRAKIIAIAGHQITVTFVDYGNTDTVVNTELRSVPSDLIQIPQLSIPVKLNIERSLTEGDIALLKSHIIDKELAVTFVSMPDSYAVNIAQENGEDVLNLLTDKRASTVSQITTVTCSIDKNYIELPPFVIPAEKSPAHVVNIDSTGILCIHLISDEVSALIEKYTADFENELYIIDDIESATYCCAKSSEDQVWYRAVVTHLDGDHVTVSFIDYDNSDNMNRNDIRAIPGDLAAIAPLLFKANVDGHDDMSKQDIALLNAKLKNDIVYVTFKSISSPYRVSIEMEHGSDMVDLLLTEPSIANAGSKETCTQKFPAPNIPSDTSLAYIVSIDSAGILHFQLPNSDDKLNEVTHLLKLYSAELDKGDCAISDPVIGLACIARFLDDMMWYRAEITASAGDHVTLRFVDYGNIETVLKTEIKIVPSDLLQIPQLSIPAKLNVQRSLTEDDIALLRYQIVDKDLVVTFISLSDSCTVNVAQEDGTDVLDLLSEKTISDAKPTIEAPDAISSMCEDIPDATVRTIFEDPVLPDEAALGYVLSIEQPGTLYIQLVKDESDITEVSSMIECFTEALNGTDYTTDGIHVGMACCSRYSEDGQWYRSLITQLDAEYVSVRFVDYGNSDALKRSEIRIIPKELLTKPVFCMPCTLVGLQTLSDTEIQILNDKILDKPLSIMFMSKLKPYEINILLDNGSNVLDLVSKNKVEPALKSDYTVQTRFTSPEMPKGCFQAYLSNIHGSVLYLQLLENENKINEMADELQGFTDILEDDTGLTDLCDGTVCCAKFATDGCWYRAVVINIIENFCTVLFVDYGNVDTILQSDIRSIPSDLLKTHVLAVPCLLSGKETFSDSEMKLLKSLMHDQTFMAELKSSSLPHHLSILLDDGRDLLDVLEEASLDETDGPRVVSNGNSKEAVQQAEASIFDGTASQEKSITSNKNCFQHTAKEFTCGNKLMLCVAHSINPHLFWCHELSAAPVLKELSNKLHSTYSDFNQACEINIPLSLQIGDACVSQFTEDEQFYRSEVLSLDSDIVEVLLVDFGISDRIKKTSIRQITDDLLTPMPQAFKCYLTGVSPGTGDSWNSTAYQHFEDLTHQKELSAEVVECVSGKLGIVLYDKGEDIGQALINVGVARHSDDSQPVMGIDAVDDGDLIVIDTDNDNSHEDLLIDLCIDSLQHNSLRGLTEICNDTSVDPTDLTTQCTDSVESEELLIDLASQSVNNRGVINTNVRNTLLIEQDDIVSRQTEFKANDIEIDGCHNSGDHVEIYLSNYSYMQLEKETELSVHISNVVNPSRFTVQPRESQSDLEQLMIDIYEYIGQTVHSGILEPGCACLAQSTDNESWCRASIISTDEENMVTVQYVDYGNQETLTSDRIRRIPSRFLELPAQSIQCCLSDITHVNGQLDWTDEAVTCFKESCNNRCLLARASLVCAVTSTFSVYLYDEADETAVSINRKLIDAGLAVVIPDSELEMEIEVEQLLENDQLDELENNNGSREEMLLEKEASHSVHTASTDTKEDTCPCIHDVAEVTNENDVPEVTNGNDVPEVSKEHDVADVINGNDVPEMTKEHDVPEMTKEHDVPEMTKEHDVPEMTKEHDVADVTKEHDVADVTKEDGVADVTNGNDVPEMTKEHDVPEMTKEHDVPEMTKGHDVADVTKEHGVEYVTKEPDVADVTEEHDVEYVTKEHDAADVTKEHEVADVTKEHDAADVTKEHDVADVTTEHDVADVTKEHDVADVTNENDVLEMTKEHDVAVVTKEHGVEYVTKEPDVADVIKEHGVEYVTKEPDVADVIKEHDVEYVTKEHDAADVTKEHDVAEVTKEHDVADVTNENDVLEMTKEHDITDMIKEHNVADVTNGNDVAEGANDLDVGVDTSKGYSPVDMM